MFDLFSDLPYYDFPSFSAALFSLLLSFFLSVLVAFSYQKTNRAYTYSKNFFQSIVLGGMVAATVMMAIGDSLVRGLGILGALAIIRYRTRLSNPRNIVFIFASFSIGISCGVYGYAIAMAGTLVFCFVAFLLHFSPYGIKGPHDTENTLTFSLEDTSKIDEIELLLAKACKSFQLISVGNSSQATKYEYIFVVRRDVAFTSIYDQLNLVEGIKGLRINYRINSERI